LSPALGVGSAAAAGAFSSSVAAGFSSAASDISNVLFNVYPSCKTRKKNNTIAMKYQ
jgi:hypothetical protein